MNKTFRRLAALLTALVVCLTALPALANLGETMVYRAEDNSGFYISSIAYLDPLIYMFDYDVVYRVWSPETGVSENLEIDRRSIEDAVGGNERIEVSRIFGGDGALYAVLVKYETEERNNGDYDYTANYFDSAYLCPIDMSGEMFAFAPEDEWIELDWDDMVESWDDNEYAREVSRAVAVDGYMYFTTYGDTGTILGKFDIETGDGEFFDEVNIESMCVAPDNIFILDSTYDDNGVSCMLKKLDADTEEFVDVCAMPVDGYNVPCNLAFDTENNALYYVLNGELFRMPDLDPEQTESIAAIQIEQWSDLPAYITSDGSYLAGNTQKLVLKSTDANLRAETTLTVFSNYNNQLENAYYPFAAAHNDVDVVLKQSGTNDILQAMLNRDDSIDIYIGYVSDSAYSTLFNRGYLAELDPDSKAAEISKSLYPSLQKLITKDDHVYSVPIEGWSGMCFSYNKNAIAELGLTEDDMPKSWPEFLAFLQRAEEFREINENITLFEGYQTGYDARYQVFNSLMSNYTLYINNGYGEMSYDTELLRGLLAEFEKIDFDNMGLIESYDDGWEDSMEAMGDRNYVFANYADVSCNVYNLESELVTMPLSIDGVAQPTIPMDLTVVFINPFSKNQELAKEYLDYAVELMSKSVLTNLCPDMNEPIRNDYYEENVKWYEEYIDGIKQSIETADEEDLPDWQVQLEEAEANYEEYKTKWMWDANEESIANYRKYGQYLVTNTGLGLDNDGLQEYYNQFQQYMDGAIDYETMLKNIDKKIKMMLQEDM